MGCHVNGSHAEMLKSCLRAWSLELCCGRSRGTLEREKERVSIVCLASTEVPRYIILDMSRLEHPATGR